jgi:hypothetical protein
VPRADTILGALTFCTEGRRSVAISYEHALMNLEHLEALAPEIPLVLQLVSSVHSVQFGPQGQVGSDESSQEVRRRATSHNRTSGQLSVLRRFQALATDSFRMRRHLPIIQTYFHRSPRFRT